MDLSQKPYIDWLGSFPWEAFLTVRIPNDIHPVKAYPPLVESVLRPLARFLKTRLAAVSVVSFGHAGEHRPHMHVLLQSKCGSLSPRISEAQQYLIAQKSTLTSHTAAVDLRQFYPERHLHYTAQHIVGESDINYYDRKLLEALKTKGVPL